MTPDKLTREQALKEMKGGAGKVSNLSWNGLGKQKMFVAVQRPDENSFMTKPYTYMEIIRKDKIVGIDGEVITNTIRVPRFPSRLDTFSNDWVVVGTLLD